MIVKARIVEHLGEGALLLSARIRAALAANDRAKVRMSALQAAAAHARSPAEAPIDLWDEARGVEIEGEAIRDVVRRAAMEEGESFRAPGLAAVTAALAVDVATMVEAVETGGVGEAAGFAPRWAALSGDLDLADDVIGLSAVRAVTSAGGKGADSVHRLVMDLHKQLNKLAAAHADEVVAGAHCSGLTGDDRRAVSAFMAGLARTRALKFDHPGLDTTAARSGDHLIIQNDIGTTDAHVLCIAVKPDAVTLTYTDVHAVRAAFFVGLFDDMSDVAWSDPSSRRVEGLAEDEAFVLVTATLAFEDRGRRDAFLERIGAALVFLIDWNKARKQVRAFVGKDDAVAVLRWAAVAGHGHRAFLELGGAALVNGAVQRAASGHIDYGVRLDKALGREQTIDFLQQVLRIAAVNLLAGKADRLVRDAIDAELAGRLERSGSTLLQGVVTQAGLARALAAGLDEVIGARADGRFDDGAATAAVAKRIEEKADRLALELRATADRYGLREGVGALIDAMEQGIDELEEAAFFLSVTPPAGAGDAVDRHLAELGATAIRSAEAVARMADAASCVPDGHRTDVEDALAALADLFALEHRADDLERATIASVLRVGASAERIFAVVECARRIEGATDLFARAGHLLRAHVIGDLNIRGREPARS